MLIPLVTAQATNTTTALWFTLIGALGGVLLTGTFALSTAILNHRWQQMSTQQQVTHQQMEQLRQDRLEAYVAYWSALQAYDVILRALAERPEESVDSELMQQLRQARSATRNATARARLVSSDEIHTAINEHLAERRGLYQDALDRKPARFLEARLGSKGTKLIRMMRSDLQGELNHPK
jgi:hypothetical protein